MLNKFLKVTIPTIIMVNIAIAQDISSSAVPTKHNKTLTIGDIAQIQAGLGSIMIEFAHRFHIIYYAAKASNWNLAKYELHELIEAQEVAETTRPKYKRQLRSFENDYLSQLNNTIKEKNWDNFKLQYSKTTIACNNCHRSNGHPYIKYILPKKAPKYFNMK